MMNQCPESGDSNNDAEDHKETLCGIGSYTPSWLQRLANVQTFTLCYSGASMLTQTLTFYINSQVPNIEKQFGLSSAEAGVLMSFNDIGFILCSLFISSIAQFVHIPRFLFYCTILYGISAVVCSLPYFFRYINISRVSRFNGLHLAINSSVGMKRGQNSNLPVCIMNSSIILNSTICDSSDNEKEVIFKSVNPGFRS